MYDKNYKYSVLMPLYYKDNPNWLITSIDSMLNQTLKPDEFIIVEDGPVTKDLEDILDKYLKKHPNLFKIYSFKENRGLGITLADGIKLCKNELICRMDADDYSIPERCEKQIKFLNENPDIDLIGSNVNEFVDSINNIVARVRLPENNDDIRVFAKRRCPIRHPSLIYKKSKVLLSGNYRDYRHAQDYNLIVHMLLKGCKMYNCQEVLVYMRVSADFYRRRGGLNQLKIILKLKKEFLDNKFYSFSDFLLSGLGNAFVCLLPNKIREVFYKRVLRK